MPDWGAKLSRETEMRVYVGVGSTVATDYSKYCTKGRVDQFMTYRPNYFIQWDIIVPDISGFIVSKEWASVIPRTYSLGVTAAPYSKVWLSSNGGVSWNVVNGSTSGGGTGVLYGSHIVAYCESTSSSYVFQGWYSTSQSAGGGTIYSSSARYTFDMPGQARTLYSRMKTAPTTKYYVYAKPSNSSGGTATVNNQTSVYIRTNTSITLRAIVSLNNYVFRGWIIGSDPKIVSTSTQWTFNWSESRTMTYYAVFEQLSNSYMLINYHKESHLTRGGNWRETNYNNKPIYFDLSFSNTTKSTIRTPLSNSTKQNITNSEGTSNSIMPPGTKTNIQTTTWPGGRDWGKILFPFNTGSTKPAGYLVQLVDERWYVCMHNWNAVYGYKTKSWLEHAIGDSSGGRGPCGAVLTMYLQGTTSLLANIPIEGTIELYEFLETTPAGFEPGGLIGTLYFNESGLRPNYDAWEAGTTTLAGAGITGSTRYAYRSIFIDCNQNRTSGTNQCGWTSAITYQNLTSLPDTVSLIAKIDISLTK